MMIKLYTDGATTNNGKENAFGGWAYIGVDEDKKIFIRDSGFIPNATNNICELTAVINGCNAVKDKNELVVVYSDSAYIINCYKQKWYNKWQINDWKNSKKEPVANKELWKQLIPYFDNVMFSFEKVPGHAGHVYNEMVDQMAVQAKFIDGAKQ